MTIHVQTLYSPHQITFGQYSDAVFAEQFKNMLLGDTQPSGYCNLTNPSYPIANTGSCGGSKYDVGWIWTFTFDEVQASHYEIDFGTDFGGGSAIYVNGVFQVAYQQDFWWAHNWNGNGVFFLVYDFDPGVNEVIVYGQDLCCDGGMYVQFSRNYQSKQLLTSDNFDCAMTNVCPGVSCQNNQYNDGPDCVDCPWTCKTCVNATYCTSCYGANKNIHPDNCTCYDGYYSQGRSNNCKGCDSSCKKCTDANSCSECESNQYLDTLCYSCSSRHGSTCGTCTKQECLTCGNNVNFLMPYCNSTSTCPQGTYKDGQWCKDCISNCEICTAGNWCQTCKSNAYRQFDYTCALCDPSCTTCSGSNFCDTCQSNEYLDPLCKPCTDYGQQCGTCNATSCITCLNDVSYKLPYCNSSSCNPIGQYMDNTWCMNCTANCLQCNDGSTCQLCEDGYYIANDQTCLQCDSSCTTCSDGTSCDTCQSDEYLDTLCKQCSLYGQQCGTCNTTSCITCLNDISYKLPNCNSTSCSIGQYMDNTWCIDCINHCIQCTDQSTCQQCDDKYYLANDQTCQPCDSSCTTCSNANSCDTCQNDEYLDTLCKPCSDHGQQCGTCNTTLCITCLNDISYKLPSCNSTSCNPTGQYTDNTWCIDCISNCLQCNNPTTCQLCEDKYYLANDQTCQPCDSSCTTCSDGISCDTCQNNEYLDTLCILCTTTHGMQCGTCTQQTCSTCLNDPSNKLPNCTSTTCPQSYYQDVNWCYQCLSNCYDCNQASICNICEDGYHLDGESTSCVQCTNAHGSHCGKCHIRQCTECLADPTYLLPFCDSTTCPNKYYQDVMTCYSCISGCFQCTNGTECQVCDDGYYLTQANQCDRCQPPCLLCQDLTTCDFCLELGYKPPDCVDCTDNFFKYNGGCQLTCPQGYFRNFTVNECQQCDSTCFDCESGKYTCTICPNQKILYKGKCVDCGDIPGMEQDPEQPVGICREICGDGYRPVVSVHECDDGNMFDGDGCAHNCTLEDGFDCVEVPTKNKDGEYDGGTKTNCTDRRPIGFTIEFIFNDQYLNIEEQAPISCVMIFNKSFTLPEGTSLKDYIVISIDGKSTQGFSVDVTQNAGNRLLQQQRNTPQYNLDIKVDQTLKHRNLEVDLYPKSAFDDGMGNKLADEPPPKGEVKEYYYYTPDERDNTKTFQLLMHIGVLCLMCFLPIYVFWYKNHFNRFYIIFFIIDITQTLYFYRFLNLRWPINGIKFFRTLRPTISFYMWNFVYTEIPDEEYHKYSSGVEKFDLEKESSLFLNNTGSILALFVIFVFFYLIIVLLSKVIKNPDTKDAFMAIRKGYFEWGIWFDSMLMSSGVFIIYVLLQLLNPTVSYMNTCIATVMGIFYFLFFFKCIRYIQKNINRLYLEERDELVDGMGLEDKINQNPTFQLRNAWFFIYQLDIFPKKAYFFFFFVLRKFYLATLLLTFQNYPKIQLCLCSFSHFIVVVAFYKYKFFKKKRENVRIMVSETLIFVGVGTCYFLLDDGSEDESYRLKYSWVVLGCLLSSLMIHGIFFFVYEIFLRSMEAVYRLVKKEPQKVKQLRDLRKKQESTAVYPSELLSSSGGQNGQYLYDLNSDKSSQISINNKGSPFKINRGQTVEDNSLKIIDVDIRQEQPSLYSPTKSPNHLLPQDSRDDVITEQNYNTQSPLNSINSARDKSNSQNKQTKTKKIKQNRQKNYSKFKKNNKNNNESSPPQQQQVFEF